MDGNQKPQTCTCFAECYRHSTTSLLKPHKTIKLTILMGIHANHVNANHKKHRKIINNLNKNCT